MPKKKKTTTLTQRLERVREMGNELKLKLEEVDKDLETMMDHIEYGPELGTKRRRRRRQS